MRILDRYILQSITKIFFATIFIFCFLFILIDIAGHMDDFIENKVPLLVIANYYISYLPIILVHGSPIASLIAALLTFSNLNHSNEVIALRASGLNFWKIAKPAILFSVIISAFVFFINERFVPQSTMASQEIKAERLKSKHGQKQVLNNLSFYGLNNRLYFIDRFDPNKDELIGITIIEQDKNLNIREKITAYRGAWTGVAWKFFNCQISIYDPDVPNKVADFKIYKERLMDIKESPSDFYQQRFDVKSMNMVQLRSYIERFSESGATSAINNLKVDLYQKMSYPFGTIVIILVGLPFALMTGRRKAMSFTSIGIAVVIGFIYYVLNAVGLALGKGGGLNPLLSAWVAPTIFFVVGMLIVKFKFN